MEKKFKSKIFIKTTCSPIDVEVMAKNRAEAEKKIEAQYGNNLKGWNFRPQEVR